VYLLKVISDFAILILSVPVEGYFRLCNRLILSVPVEGYFRLCDRLILSVTKTDTSN
jgi:hypothetical protein